MQAVIADNLTELGALCRRFGVRRLEVFGSAAAGSDFTESSDVDFLVEFDPATGLDPLQEYFGLRAALSELLIRPIDLVEVGALKNPFVLRSIERSRQLVFAA